MHLTSNTILQRILFAAAAIALCSQVAQSAEIKVIAATR
jgi:hypothetical protein